MNPRLKATLRSIRDYLPNKVQQWRRTRQLSTERKHYTRSELAADLNALPIPQNAVVLVHSSLKSIGFVDGGPQTVVDALIESIVRERSGTLMLPTYSINGTMRNTLLVGQSEGGIVFDVRSTPSNLGAIPEAFRRHPGVVRSVHPTHSFGAIGALAEELVAEHHTCGSSFGRGSPMAKMLEHDGWLLGLGTNLGTVTFYHCLEEIEPDYPLNVYSPDSPFTVRCRDGRGEVHLLTLGAHDEQVSANRIDRPHSETLRAHYTRQFEKNAGLTWHTVGEARSWLISARRFYEEAKAQVKAGVTVYTSESELERLVCSR